MYVYRLRNMTPEYMGSSDPMQPVFLTEKGNQVLDFVQEFGVKKKTFKVYRTGRLYEKFSYNLPVENYKGFRCYFSGTLTIDAEGKLINTLKISPKFISHESDSSNFP